MDNKDYKKLLAFAIAHVNKEIGKAKVLVEGEISSFRERLSEETLVEFKKIILEEALSQVPIRELPDGLIFESDLDEKSFFIEQEIKRSYSNSISKIHETSIELNESILGLDNYIRSLDTHVKGHNHDEDYSKLSHDHDNTYSALGHTHDYVSNESYDKHRASYLEFLDNHKIIIDSIKQTTDNHVDAITKRIGQLEADTAANLKSKADELQKRSENAVGALSLHYEDKLRSHTTEHKEALESHHTSLNKHINTTTTELKQSKADKDHKHDDYAGINHSHFDLASKDQINQIDSRIRELGGKDSALENSLQKIKDELSKKVDNTNVLTKKDLDDTIDYIRGEVLKSIPMPENGKDAKEWIFTFHPSKRGFLLYRREDWYQWKGQNLLPASTQETSPFGYTGGGGTGGYVERLTIENRAGEAIENVHKIIFGVGTSVVDQGDGVVEIRATGGGSTPYIADLNGFTFVIPAEEHEKGSYPLVNVYNASGNEIEIAYNINTQDDITIESNVPLNNFTAVIR